MNGILISVGVLCFIVVLSLIVNAVVVLAIANKKQRPQRALPELEELAKRLSWNCLLYTSPSPRDGLLSRMPSSA